jgi:outer membrane protein assembly factor BamD
VEFVQSPARNAIKTIDPLVISMIPNRNKLFRNLLALAGMLVLGVVAGCAGNDEEFDLASSIEEAYIEAQEAVQVGNYRKAISIFEQLQARFPFSDFSTQIQLELAYSYYMDRRIEQAIDASDTFIRENPTHARIDYALYIKALAHFEREQGMIERMFRRDVDKRPPRDGELAFGLLSRLVERYPASPYAADAQQRMIYLKNRLAAYENVVARFYLEREAYVAALNRAKTALEQYNGAESGAESLQIMIEAYEGLGMTELAEDARRVLQKNFSDDSVVQN